MKFLWPLLLVIVLAVFTRGYQLPARFMYAHDNDLASWIVKDMVVDGHIRLIGQLTTTPGIFIGPLFYYALVPLYFFFRLDPLFSLGFSFFIGLFSTFSIYYVFRRLYNRFIAFSAAAVFAASFMIALNEREVVPTTPVWLWSIWFYYAINKLFTGSTSALYLLAVLFALVWHLNLALVLLFPLVLIAVVWRHRLFKPADFTRPVLLFIALTLPLFIFEIRHGFIQSRALLTSLSTVGSPNYSFISKLIHVSLYAAKNSTGLFLPFIPSDFSPYLLPAILITVIFLAAYKRRIPRVTAGLVITWLGLYLLFFSLHPINLSEYYLNGLNILWIAGAAFFLAWVRDLPFGPWLTAVFLVIFIGYHLYVFISSPVNQSGYYARQALVAAIAADAKKHNFPCVAVSYMTDPGYNFGYRYLFWMQKLPVNLPKSGSPVYTIVFPHHRADRLDYTFGALGLILPDYSRYHQAAVYAGCAGPDANLTEPMFGFTN